jgi:uncharacterized pyridoxal phosphate-containing UPF0001 family protein
MSNLNHTEIAERIQAVQARIDTAEQRFGREPGSVRLLAVSKRQPLDKIIAARAAGLRAFGESYAQEGVDKQQALAELEGPGPEGAGREFAGSEGAGTEVAGAEVSGPNPAGQDIRQAIQWHFIGRVQSNKTRLIAEHFDWVHGLFSVEHARRLAAQRPAARGPLHVCLQVNLSGEASKAGVAPDALEELLREVVSMDGLRLEGLMTLPAPAADFAAQRRPFAALRALRDHYSGEGLALPMLSMGMSQDLEAAIAEGATMVRIGTALFGERAQA